MEKSPVNDISISEHFILSEFECPCCHRVILDVRLLELLESLRARLGGRPIIINSGYRCVSYNKKVGGVPKSYHLYGMAADVRVPGIVPQEVRRQAYQAGFTGLGLYESFCHLDIRPYFTRWEGS